jgi:hypothetical protein
LFSRPNSSFGKHTFCKHFSSLLAQKREYLQKVLPTFFSMFQHLRLGAITSMLSVTLSKPLWVKSSTFTPRSRSNMTWQS